MQALQEKRRVYRIMRRIARRRGLNIMTPMRVGSFMTSDGAMWHISPDVVPTNMRPGDVIATKMVTQASKLHVQVFLWTDVLFDFFTLMTFSPQYVVKKSSIQYARLQVKYELSKLAVMKETDVVSYWLNAKKGDVIRAHRKSGKMFYIVA